jgi:hypothetical protein
MTQLIFQAINHPIILLMSQMNFLDNYLSFIFMKLD